MKHHKDSSALFWMLLGGSFVLIFALWLPSVKKNVSALTSSMSSEVVAPTSDMVGQLAKIRDSFDVYFKETYKKLEQSTASSVLDKTTDTMKKELDTNAGSALPTSDARETPLPVETNDAKKFCTKQGGSQQQRKGPGQLIYNVCIFSDGSECEELAYMNNQCHKGQYMVAEKGIIKKADLEVRGEKADYCPKENEKTLCVKNVAVINNGWTSSPRSHAVINNAFYAVPELEPGASHLIMEMLEVPNVSGTATILITADAKKQIDEANENNNTYTFPEK